jgi:flagellar hook-length control protein FliK
MALVFLTKHWTNEPAAAGQLLRQTRGSTINFLESNLATVTTVVSQDFSPSSTGSTNEWFQIKSDMIKLPSGQIQNSASCGPLTSHKAGVNNIRLM